LNDISGCFLKGSKLVKFLLTEPDKIFVFVKSEKFQWIFSFKNDCCCLGISAVMKKLYLLKKILFLNEISLVFINFRTMVQSYSCPVFFYIGRPECLDDDAVSH